MGWPIWEAVPHSELRFDPASFEAKVSKTPYCWEWTGGRHKKTGYGSANVKKADGSKTTARAHKLAYLLHVGPVPEGKDVDHRCHNRGCVNPSHLRLLTRKQNAENRGELSIRNKSGYRGVSWSPSRQKWVATVGHNWKRIHVGCFDTAKEAGEAARAKRNELYTHNDLDRKAAA